MIIYDSFYLSGFTRIDKGEAGAVFVQYGEPVKTFGSEMECLSWHGAKSATYAISLPARPVVACAIVTRTSKNNYTATVFDERRIETFRAHSLDSLRRTVADFFKGIAA